MFTKMSITACPKVTSGTRSRAYVKSGIRNTLTASLCGLESLTQGTETVTGYDLANMLSAGMSHPKTAEGTTDYGKFVATSDKATGAFWTANRDYSPTNAHDCLEVNADGNGWLLDGREHTSFAGLADDSPAERKAALELLRVQVIRPLNAFAKAAGAEVTETIKVRLTTDRMVCIYKGPAKGCATKTEV